MNRLPIHPLQTAAWGAFRKKTEQKVIRGKTGFQMTIHRIPLTFWAIGYVPKGPLPTRAMVSELEQIGRQERCIFIQLEPNVQQISNLGLRPSFHPLFTRYTFQIDLTKSESELLKAMHPKTRYNIRVAQRHGVTIKEDNSDAAFETYIRLTKETTKRQKFFAHDEQYHRLMWETLKPLRVEDLTAYLLLAKYKGEVLIAWILFVCDGILYYPYGASSSKHREVMASNLMMWEAIRFGKKLGLKTFDLWGALGPHPEKSDPWYGFHRFKEGYGGKLVEFVGSFDLVLQPFLYQLYKVADKVRWVFLRLLRW